MKTIILLFLLFASSISFAEQIDYVFENSDKTIKVLFKISTEKKATYKVLFNEKIIIDDSELGIIRGDADFYNNLEITSVSESIPVASNYTMVQGKRKRNNYLANKYTIQLKNKSGKLFTIIFQLSADGVAFRYHFPEKSLDIKTINEEKTSFKFIKDSKAWLQPMSKAKTGWKETNPSYEEHYVMNVPVDTKSIIGEGWVFPGLFNSNNTWVLLTEAGIQENYCGSHLNYNEITNSIQLVFPQKEEQFPNGTINPISKLPWSTPWRIIALGSLKTIIESTLGTDLAEPEISMDTTFIKSGLASWSWALLKDDSVNNETSIQFIDYAASMNWTYCLIDVDWNIRIGIEKMKELALYAKNKNIKLIVWYNSSGTWNSTTYEPKSKLLSHSARVKEFAKLKEIGISGIKVDFFGGDGQSMIAYYHDILKDAAQYKLVVNFHGATLPRGWQRTYPNLLTVEAVKGEEFITFFQENADLEPSHCTMLPFARNVFDPMDFTPMVLDTIPNIIRKTTPAFELALPVLFLSGIQHIAETPLGMSKMPEYVKEYMRDIPTDWDDSKFIDGYPGKFIVVARRKNTTWYFSGINGENTEKTIELDVSFITNESGYIIKDDTDGFSKEYLSKTNIKLKIDIKPFGGFVIKF